jgi:hypothetical protein
VLFDEMRALVPGDHAGLSLSYHGFGLSHPFSPVATASMDLRPEANVTEVLEGVRANALQRGWDADPVRFDRDAETATFNATRGNARLQAEAGPESSPAHLSLRLQIVFS